MSEEKKPTALELDDLMPGDVIRIAVTPKSEEKKDQEAFILFEPMDGVTLTNWRKTQNGNGNPRKANPKKASQYLIDRKYAGTENLNVRWQEKGYKDEKDYWKNDERAFLFMDMILDKYIGAVIPDSEDLKN